MLAKKNAKKRGTIPSLHQQQARSVVIRDPWSVIRDPWSVIRELLHFKAKASTVKNKNVFSPFSFWGSIARGKKVWLLLHFFLVRLSSAPYELTQPSWKRIQIYAVCWYHNFRTFGTMAALSVINFRMKHFSRNWSHFWSLSNFHPVITE